MLVTFENHINCSLPGSVSSFSMFHMLAFCVCQQKCLNHESWNIKVHIEIHCRCRCRFRFRRHNGDLNIIIIVSTDNNIIRTLLFLLSFRLVLFFAVDYYYYWLLYCIRYFRCLDPHLIMFVCRRKKLRVGYGS